MLELVSGAPAETFALRASGTVMSRDIEDAIEAALGPSVASTGFVILIDQDFEGYLAELARGLANAALTHKSLVKVALVADAGLIDEAKLSGFEVSAVPIRIFPTAERQGALDWAAAARRGE
jgi:hypothetical protein